MPSQRWVVGIAADAATTYGRAIVRGILRYANARREWLIHQEPRAHSGISVRWPECDGAIFAGVAPHVVEQVRQRSRHMVSCSGVTDPATMPVVCADSNAIGRVAAEHLLD